MTCLEWTSMGYLALLYIIQFCIGHSHGETLSSVLIAISCFNGQRDAFVLWNDDYALSVFVFRLATKMPLFHSLQ